MPFLERDGARLYYETHGAGPALVFAHGLGGGHLAGGSRCLTSATATCA